mmetsp:Transcript_9119/g.28514  ORF Transcript_9119/g.28514 Transcript_9119/m.28514 type:complete len:473 (+) Transcript_9119:429-1847(+)
MRGVGRGRRVRREPRLHEEPLLRVVRDVPAATFRTLRVRRRRVPHGAESHAPRAADAAGAVPGDHHREAVGVDGALALQGWPRPRVQRGDLRAARRLGRVQHVLGELVGLGDRAAGPRRPRARGVQGQRVQDREPAGPRDHDALVRRRPRGRQRRRRRVALPRDVDDPAGRVADDRDFHRTHLRRVRPRRLPGAAHGQGRGRRGHRRSIAARRGGDVLGRPGAARPERGGGPGRGDGPLRSGRGPRGPRRARQVRDRGAGAGPLSRKAQGALGRPDQPRAQRHRGGVQTHADAGPHLRPRPRLLQQVVLQHARGGVRRRTAVQPAPRHKLAHAAAARDEAVRLRRAQIHHGGLGADDRAAAGHVRVRRPDVRGGQLPAPPRRHGEHARRVGHHERRAGSGRGRGLAAGDPRPRRRIARRRDEARRPAPLRVREAPPRPTAALLGRVVRERLRALLSRERVGPAAVGERSSRV